MSGAAVQKKLQAAALAGKQRDYTQAADILEEILADPAAPPEALLYLGRAYHAKGEYPLALAAFRDYLIQRPDSNAGIFFMARSYLAAGVYLRAVALLKRVLEKKPDNSSALFLMGTAFLKAKSSSRAVHWFQKAVEAAPDNSRIYQAYLNALLIKALNLSKKGEYSQAAAILEFITENGLSAPLPYLELGRLARIAGNELEALKYYIKAAELSPSDPKIRWHIAALYFSLGAAEQGKEELEKIRSLGELVPEPAEHGAALVDYCNIQNMVRRGAWQEAIDGCRAWFKTYHNTQEDPIEQAVLHTMLAESLRNTAQYDLALEHAERAIQLAPTIPELKLELLLVLKEQEHWSRLEKELARAQQLDEAIRLSFSALIADATNTDDKAVLELVQTAIKKAGPSVDLMLALARRWQAIGIYDLAAEWFRKVRTLAPENETAWLGEIACSEEMIATGDTNIVQQFEAACEGYIERWPENRDIQRSLASHWFTQQNWQKAANAFEQLLIRENANPTLRRMLAYCYRKLERYREAIVLLKGLLRGKPDSLDTLIEFISCLEAAGSAKWALATAEKALPLFSKSQELRVLIARLQLRFGNTEEALTALRRAAEICSNKKEIYAMMAKIYKKNGIHEMAQRYEELSQHSKPVNNKNSLI